MKTSPEEQSTKNTLDYKDIVRRRFLNELESFQGSLGKSNIYESHSKTTEHISVSYKGRTLIELIQNGYDPHPAGRSDGEIAILLDLEESNHGCLYVANRGYGFSKENFDGICDMARSSKVVNQGIGNKGLGFRGVLQVCQNPEIYSQDGKGFVSDDFQGFRFTFPTNDLLAEKLSNGPFVGIKEQVLNSVPKPLLPVYLDYTPTRVREYAKNGFATVIRMPLARKEAADEIIEQIDFICGQDVPINLFLNRLKLVDVAINDDRIGDESKSFHQSLQRSLQKQWSDQDITFELVAIDDERSYLVASKSIPQSDFRPRLKEGIANGQLPESWGNWQGDPEISIAVETSGNEPLGRLYNFLPMESTAGSPFAGHINAPYLCDIDRTNPVDDVDLNDYFLEQAANLCLSSLMSLKGSFPKLARLIAIDLTIWTDHYWEVIGEAANTYFGKTIDKLPIIPTCPGSSNYPWACIEDLSGWPTGGEEKGLLSQTLVAKVAELSFLSTEINQEGIKRLESLSRFQCDIELEPDFNDVASWCEKVAIHMLDKQSSESKWNQYYKELTDIFSGHPESLRGKSILLTENGKLASTLAITQSEEEEEEEEEEHAGKRRKIQSVFLPSTKVTQASDTEGMADEEDNLFQRIPSSLTGSIQVVLSKLKLAQRKDDSGVRAFLIDNRLVNSFRREDLQRTLANITRNPGPGKRSEQRRLGALRLAFELFEGGIGAGELSEMPFSVPTQGGTWVSAGAAYFSKEWPKTNGMTLERLFNAGSSCSEELAKLNGTLLAPPGELPGEVNHKEWITFLRKIGVNDVLRVFNARPRGVFKFQGYQLGDNIIRRCLNNKSLAQSWRRDIPEEIQNPYTNYSVRMVPMLPGLNDYDTFPKNLREYFAIELLKALIEHGDSVLSISIYRPDHGSYDNKTNWPSPIVSFLRHFEWLPSSENESVDIFRHPSDVWLVSNTGRFEHTRFLTSVIGRCRGLLDENDSLRDFLQEECGLKVLGSYLSAAHQIRELGKLAYDQRISRSDVSIFDGVYAQGWQLVSEDGDQLQEVIGSSGLCLAAHREDDVLGFSLELCEDKTQSNQTINTTTSDLVYLADDVSPTTRDLLKELGKPIFDFKFESRAEVAIKLCDKFANLTRVSKVGLSVYADGTLQTSDLDSSYLISSQRRWLQDSIIVICDLSSVFMEAGTRPLDSLRQSISQIRYKLVGNIEVEIDGERHALPDFLQNSLLIGSNDAPLLLIETEDDDLSWSVLTKAAHSIAEGLGRASQLDSVLSSAFSQLAAKQGIGAFDEPTEADYQAICRKGKQTVREAIRSLRHISEVMIELLRPVIVSCTDFSTSERIFNDLETADSEESVSGVLYKYENELDLDIDIVIEACRRGNSLNEIRSALNIELTVFNHALQKLGSPYLPLTFHESQEIAFRSFVKSHAPDIFNCLRSKYVSAFDKHSSLNDYVSSITLKGLEPAAEWANQYDDVPEEVSFEHINGWLNALGAPRIGAVGPIDELEVNECREVNRKQLNRFVYESWPIISAWCAKHKVELPTVWRIQSDVQKEITQIFSTLGFLDFRALGHDDMIKRIHLIGQWPQSMPFSNDLDELEIELSELSDSHQKEIARQNEKELRGNTIIVGDQEFSIKQPDITEKLDSLLKLYSSNPGIWNRSTRITRLDQISGRKKHGGKQGSSGTGRGMSDRMPQGQKDAIGLLGEKLAFEWLKRHYADLVDEKCWVSGNRELALQTEAGNDSLGFDFQVDHPNYVGYYEAKATSGNDYFFRMGPTEVEQAVKCRSDTKHRYRIIFIKNVADPKEARIELLPNPFSEKNKEKFSIVSKGEVGLTFNLK